MTLQAIIFGVDGVVAETQEARREAFNRVFSEAGVDWCWGRTLYAELLKATGGDNMILAFVNSHLPRWRQTDDVMQLIAAMKRRHAAIYKELLDSAAVKLRPGMAHFLCTVARSGVRLAIATNESAAHVTSLLRANLGATGAAVFEAVTTPDDGVEKGARDTHARALKALSLAPEDCLAIESSTGGLRSAVAAGIPSVITWGIYPQLQECADALLSAKDMSPASASNMILARWDPGMSAEQRARDNRKIAEWNQRSARVFA
jgi:HAD superfamily hydrolase (TIGR01509 family)